MGRSRRRSMVRLRGLSCLAVLATGSASRTALATSTNSSATTTTSSTSPASDDYCAAPDDNHNNFTLVGSVTDPVSVLRLSLDGCESSSSPLRTNRFAVTIEPSRSNNASFVSTVPPYWIEPVYARAEAYDSAFLGVLSFRLNRTTVSAFASASAPPRAGVRVRVPPNQLRSVVIDVGSPFYVYIRDGFTRLSSIHIEAGYGLRSTPGGGNIHQLGAQLVDDLSSSTVPLTLGLDGDGAKVKVRSRSTIESLQISTLGSDIAIRGDLECNPANLPCYVLAGDGGGAPERSTVMLLEGSMLGPVSTSATLSASRSERSGTNNAFNQTTPSLQMKINDPYYVGNPCNSLRRNSGGGSPGLRCTPTNETVDFNAWFPCTTPLDSDFGSVQCSRTDASSTTRRSDMCHCSVKIKDSPGVSPIVQTSSGSRRGLAGLPWLVGLSALVCALLSALY